MAENNEIAQVFELFGVIGVDIKEAIKNITAVDDAAADAAKSISKSFKDLERDISNIELSANVDTDSAVAEIERFKQQTRDMMQDIETDATIVVDSEQAVKDLRRLEGQLNRMQIKVQSGDFSESTGAQRQRERVQETMTTIRENVNVTESRTVEKSFLKEVTNNILQNLKTGSSSAETINQSTTKGSIENRTDEDVSTFNVDTLIRFASFLDDSSKISNVLQQTINKVNEVVEKVRNSDIATSINKIMNVLRESLNKLTKIDTKVDKIVRYTAHKQIINTSREHVMSSSAASNAPPAGTQVMSGAELATLLAAQNALGNTNNYGTSYYRNRGPNGYDLNHSQAIEQAMQRRFLEYAQKMTPQMVLPRVEQSLNLGSAAVPYFLDAKNLMQVQAAFGMIESGATNARKQLSQLGFGRTKQEIKSVEAQMHTLANVRMDNLKDNIRLTETALKDMKKSARANDYVEEISKATKALNRYKNELAAINTAKKAGEVEGYKVGRFGGKDILIKEYKSIFDKIGGAMIQSVNRDLARSLNMTYNSLDKNAIKIVGDQGTKALNKTKVSQLATAFQTLGMQMQTLLPIIGALAIGVGAIGKTIDEAVSSFGKKSLLSDGQLERYREDIQDVSNTTGASREDTAKGFNDLYLDRNLRGKDLSAATETGLNFNNTFENVGVVEAFDSLKEIQDKLKVSEQEAKNILASALSRYNGDLEQATKSILEHKDGWKDIVKETEKGREAYKRMTQDISLWDRLVKVANKFRTILETIWHSLDPLLSPILEKIEGITDTTLEFLRSHKQFSQLLGVVGLLTTSFVALSTVLLPMMGFLIMNRSVFQALGQGLRFIGTGMTVVNPQARMLLDNMKLMRSGLLGLPRLMRSFVPGLFSLFRGLPIMIASTIGQFIKLNPILTAIGVVFLLVYKNFDKYKDSLSSIWDSLKRIASSILTAFGGEGASTVEKFDSILQKISDVAATVLVPAFEALAKALEWVANIMESGGGKITASILKWTFFATVLGGIIQSLSKTKDAMKGLFSPLQKVLSLFSKLAPFLGLSSGSIDINENKNNRTDKNINKNNPNNKEGIGNEVPNNIYPSKINAANIYINGANVNIEGFEGEDDGPFEAIQEKLEEQQEGNEEDNKGKGKVVVHGSPVFVQGRRAGDVPNNDRGPLVDGQSSNNNTDTRNNRNGQPPDVRPPRVDTGNQDNAPKKWYQKLLGGFSKFGGKLGKGIGKIFGGVIKFVAKGLLRLVPFVGTAIFVLFDVLPIVKDLLGPLVPSIMSFAKKAAKGFVNGFKGIIAGASKILRRIGRIFGRIFGGLSKTVSKYARKITKGFTKGIRGILTGARNVLGKVGKFFSKIFKGIYDTVSKWFGNARKFFGNGMRRIREITASVLRRIWEYFVEKFMSIYDTITKWLGKAWDFIKKVFAKIRDFMKKILKKIAKIISDKFKESYDSAKKWLGKMWDKVVGIFTDIGDFFTGIANDANQWGADIIRGIWEGMKDKAESMLGWITELGESIADLFKKAMGIRSPSRVMRAIAKWIPIGVGLGINDGAKDVKKATRGMSDTIVKSFKPKLTTDDIMNGIVKSKQSNTRKLNLSVASAKASSVKGSGALGGITVQNMTVNNHTERAAKGFHETTQTKLDREVRRKVR